MIDTTEIQRIIRDYYEQRICQEIWQPRRNGYIPRNKMHDDLNICTDDPWRSPLLSESGPHLTVATHSHSHTPEPVITNNLTASIISISSILLFSHPLFFQFTSSKIFFKTPVLQSIDPTTISLSLILSLISLFLSLSPWYYGLNCDLSKNMLKS